MPDVYLGRINRFIEKLLNIKGGPTLVDVEPGVSVESVLKSGFEDYYLQGWNLYGQIKQSAANVGNFSGAQLFNHSTTGIICVVMKITVLGTVSTTSQAHLSILNAGPTGADLASAFSGFRLDQRGNQASASIFSTGNAAGLDTPNILLATGFNNLQASDMIPNFEIPLLPGDLIRVVDATANEAVNISILWRERAIETSESS